MSIRKGQRETRQQGRVYDQVDQDIHGAGLPSKLNWVHTW